MDMSDMDDILDNVLVKRRTQTKNHELERKNIPNAQLLLGVFQTIANASKQRHHEKLKKVFDAITM